MRIVALDILRLNFPLDNQVAMSNRQLDLWVWNSEKRFKLEAHLGVISKMLIAEISRMYALVDGKIATMKVRETGAAEVERLEILLCPIIYGKCDQYGLKITAGNFCNDTHL